MSVTRQIGPEAEQHRKRRTWTRVYADAYDAYTIAICIAAGFLDGWPMEITRDGARAIRRGEVVAEAEQRATNNH